MTKKRLGRGLGAIYGEEVVEAVENDRKAAEKAGMKRAAGSGTSGAETADKNAVSKAQDDEKGKVVMLRISRIVPGEGQPRQNFDEESLKELSESIRQHGVIQPLIVREKGSFYEIITGERRWRAARMAGLKEIPVLIREYDEQASSEISLIENVQREDLNPIEEAAAYKRLMDEYGLKQDEIADRVSKDRTTITNSLRLLKLSPEVKQMVAEGILSGGHARALLGIRSAEKQTELARMATEKQMSVRQVEAAVKRLAGKDEKKAGRDNSTSQDAVDIAYEDLEERLTSIISSKVSIKRRNKEKGKIEIEYASQDELERIAELFESVKS